MEPEVNFNCNSSEYTVPQCIVVEFDAGQPLMGSFYIPPIPIP